MSVLINAYCTLRSPPELDFEHGQVSHRDRSDPELETHLHNFVGYVMSKNQGEMTQLLYHVVCHIQRVHHQFSLAISDDNFDDFARWAWDANALCFLPDGTIRDPSGSILFDPENAIADNDADVPYPDDARLRRTRTIEQLQAWGISIPASMPPVVSELEVVPREAAEVAKRFLALFLVAVRAESLASDDAVDVEDLRETSTVGFKALSPNEQLFLENAEPDEESIIQFTWRYEAICVLQWALRLIDELPLPTGICDVQEVARLAMDNNTRQFLKTCRLRPIDEILETLDLHYRMHWAVRQASIKKQPMPAGLNPGVIGERHYALNWLVRFEDKDWDDVDTPT